MRNGGTGYKHLNSTYRVQLVPKVSPWLKDLVSHHDVHLASCTGRSINSGIVRTDVLLYGELRDKDQAAAVAAQFDFNHLGKPDLLLVVGTSLRSTYSGTLRSLRGRLL